MLSLSDFRLARSSSLSIGGGSRGGAANPVRAVAGAGAVIFCDWVGGRLSSGVSVAATGLRRAGEGSASCFLSRISGWRDRRLYPLAGGSRGGAANPVRAVAGAGAVIFCDWVGGRLSSGVSVAATGLRRAGEGSASCFLSRISGWRDRRLYPLAGAAEVARRIRCAPWPAPVLSFFVIGSAGV